MKSRYYAVCAFAVCATVFLTSASYGQSCTFKVSPESITVWDESTATVTVEASDPTCSFTASSAYPWITVSPAQGKGNGKVTLSLQSNAMIQRIRGGAAQIAGHEVEVTQLVDPQCDASGSGQ
jgi:hypothetical protein